jgi:hypothetical protein
MSEIVIIKCDQDLVNLGGEMKKVSIEYPRDRMPILPNSKEELGKNINGVMDEENSSKLKEFYQRASRAAAIGCHIVSLCLTLDKFETPHVWNLSMVELVGPSESGKINLSNYREVPDDVAMRIAELMLGGKCERAEREGKVLTTIKHFKKVLV